jgi:hypothetical protein
MPDSDATFGDQLLRAHAALHGALHGLREALNSPAEARLKLLGLRAIVRDHFRREEQGGYLAPVLLLQPQQERVVRRLLGEHRLLAEALDALVQEAAAATAIEDGFRQRVGAWAEELRRHEADENVLVEDAFNRDVGPED